MEDRFLHSVTEEIYRLVLARGAFADAAALESWIREHEPEIVDSLVGPLVDRIEDWAGEDGLEPVRQVTS